MSNAATTASPVMTRSPMMWGAPVSLGGGVSSAVASRSTSTVLSLACAVLSAFTVLATAPGSRIEIGQLGTRHRADEVLLEQKLEEGRQPPVTELAPEIREVGRVLQVVGQRQPSLATGAVEQGR